MKYLIKSALILDKKSPFYKKRVDFIVANGKISEISSSISPPKNIQIISGKKLVLTPALIDINAQSGEPNNTEAETLSSLIEAGSAGGFFFHEGEFHLESADLLEQLWDAGVFGRGRLAGGGEGGRGVGEQ